MASRHYKTHIVSNTSSYSELYKIDVEKYDETAFIDWNQGFSARTHNRLCGAGIQTIRDLLKTNDDTLRHINGFGASCIRDVNEYVKGLANHSELKDKDSGYYDDEYNQCGTTPDIFKQHRKEIFEGSFSFVESDSLSENEKTRLEKYKKGHQLLDQALIVECRDNPAKLVPIIRMFHEYYENWRPKKEKLSLLHEYFRRIPNERWGTHAKTYIIAYTEDKNLRERLLSFYCGENVCLKDIAYKNLTNNHDFDLALRFLKWCSFDVGGEISELFAMLYKAPQDQFVLEQRAKRHTLESVGDALCVTRERVRQIEQKIYRRFFIWYRRNRLLEKISALKDGDEVLTRTKLHDYFGEHFCELLYLLRKSKDLSYAYDRQLDVFIVNDTEMLGLVREYVETLPDVFLKNQIERFVDVAAEKGLSSELTEIMLADNYYMTGDTCHRNRLSLGAIYNTILHKYYKDGLRVYDAIELENFKTHIYKEFGDIELPENNRALSVRLSSIGILCGRGKYCSKKDVEIPHELIDRICQYIDNSESPVFLTNTLFSIFEDELLEHGIDNKYFLQGVLHEAVGDRYLFRRDYVSKDEAVTTIYAEIVNYIKRFDHPIDKKQILKVYPGVSDIVLNLAMTDSNIINLFGEYIHKDRLSFLDSDLAYFRLALDKTLGRQGCCNSRDIFEYIERDNPVRLTRLYIMSHFGLYSLLECLFRNEYQFMRPYIARQGIMVNHPFERLSEMIRHAEIITLAEITEFARDMHYGIPSILDFVNLFNDTHLLKNATELATIQYLGVDEACANQIESCIAAELRGTQLISKLECIYDFPPINVPWTEWLIYSVVYKWANKLEAGLFYTNTQHRFKYSVPIISFKGKLNIDDIKFDDASAKIGVADDLSNIDALIADYIEEELEGFDT